MSWIKRNLYFLIGGAVALALMGLAGWYLYSKWDLNNAILKDLDEQYGKLANLIGKTGPYFQRLAAVPDVAKVSDKDFSSALSRSIAQLQHEATNASVSLQPDYSFSFAAEKNKVTFAAAGLGPLSVQLGEVKAICDILFAAKINWLDGLRRERVSADDAAGLQTDYLEQKSITNDLAVLAPYALEFRCFSSELASVLSAFAASPYGFIVKTINVELAAPGGLGQPGPLAIPGMPAPSAPGASTPAAPLAAVPLLRRSGIGGGAAPGGIAYRPLGRRPAG